MKKILALLLSLVAVFSLATACTPDSDLSGGGSSGGSESGITSGGSSDSGNSDSGSSGSGSGGGSTVVPPITDGGNFDGGDY